MSANVACKCADKNKRDNWRVIKRNYNESAFNGYHRTQSDYSTVICLRCRGGWRTKADYVSSIKDFKQGEIL